MKIIIMTEHIEAKIMSRILMKRWLLKDRLRQNETLRNEKKYGVGRKNRKILHYP